MLGVKKGVIERYRERLPVPSDARVITLGEGSTPLIESINLRDKLGIKPRLFFKFDGANPTGSFKDRGMTVAITMALYGGAKASICASTGNTAASASAYSARAGISCFVIIPKGKVAYGKLSQALIYGAKVIEIDGNFDEALNLVRRVGEIGNIAVVNSVNPYRIEGQKTVVFEVCEELGRAPDYHALPVGNAGNITAHWKGYKEVIGEPGERPKMLGFQAEGAAPIVLNRVIKNPETIATAIRIGNPASWEKAVEARDESGGLIDMVTDEEIIQAYKFLAVYEGIFCEPASAASLAGVIKLNRQGYFKSDGEVVVCTLTGSGLKDPDTAISSAEVRVITVKPDLDEILRIILS
jgi:threonine synthase